VNPSLAVTGDDEAGKAVQLPEVPLAAAPGQSAQRARSLPPAPGGAPQATPDITERDRLPVVRNARARALAALSGPSLLHARPPSLAEQRERHHQAAAHFEAALLRWPRLAWGYWHLAVKAVLHLTEWVLESPPRLAAAAAVAVIVWFWI
jgi:hypothetical protein